MNKQTKLALFIAPLLVVGGYIASDQYVVHQTSKGLLFNLSLENDCQLFSGDCILKSGDVHLNITDEGGVTKVNTSYPADKVTISLVSSDNKEIIYELNKASSFQYWQRKTAIRASQFDQQSLKSLHIMVKIKGDLYLSELNASMIK
jgi:hypothetical protein